MTGKNIGDLLNAERITWGTFAGGFDLQTVNANGTTGCVRSTYSAVTGGTTAHYVPHHMWSQYFTSTANPTHARPSSTEAIGSNTLHDGRTPEPANHTYDLNDFYAALQAGNFPSVSYVKMPAYQDSHPGYSDPPFDRHLGETPAMTAQDEADIIAFLRTLNDGYKPAE